MFQMTEDLTDEDVDNVSFEETRKQYWSPFCNETSMLKAKSREFRCQIESFFHFEGGGVVGRA